MHTNFVDQLNQRNTNITRGYMKIGNLPNLDIQS